MKKTKETKLLFKSWKSFLNESRIISLAELVNIISSNENYTEDDINKFIKFWNSNQFSSKYSQVIKNDLEKGEPISHIVVAVIEHYNKVYQSASPKIKSSIGDGSYSVDDLRKDLDAKVQSGRFNKLEVRQQCQYQNERPVVGKYNDFDVVYSESDWIIIEPKTILGSIAWGQGKPDGSEETDQARRVGWCTAVSSGNNMFPNYAGNLHMFYLINTNYDNISGPDRRLCLSFTKINDEVALQFDNGASVDANNSALTAEYIEKHVGENILNLIKNLVSERKETSFKEIYSKITVSQLIRQIKQMKSQGVSQENIKQELSSYALYAVSEEVVNYLMTSFVEEYDLHISIIESVADRPDLADLAEGSVINKLFKDENKWVRASVASNSNTPKELLEVLAKDENKWVRAKVASNSNTPKEALEYLAKDEDEWVVRDAVASNSNTPKEALEYLAKDEDMRVRVRVASNSNTPKEALEYLAKDENRSVAWVANKALEMISEKFLRSYIELLIK